MSFNLNVCGKSCEINSSQVILEPAQNRSQLVLKNRDLCTIIIEYVVKEDFTAETAGSITTNAISIRGVCKLWEKFSAEVPRLVEIINGAKNQIIKKIRQDDKTMKADAYKYLSEAQTDDNIDAFMDWMYATYPELAQPETPKNIRRGVLCMLWENTARMEILRGKEEVPEIYEIPPQIVEWFDGTKIRIVGNQLSKIPPDIEKLRFLTVLDLEDNNLTEIPTQLGNLISLLYLNLVQNKLLTLPTEIGQLYSLEILKIRWNQLSTLPTEIGQLSSLRELAAEGNQLSTLPTEIGQLSCLKELAIDGNQLSKLPPQMENLTSLVKFYFDLGNLELKLPRSMKNIMHNIADQEPIEENFKAQDAEEAEQRLKQRKAKITLEEEVFNAVAALNITWFKGHSFCQEPLNKLDHPLAVFEEVMESIDHVPNPAENDDQHQRTG